MLGVAQDIMLKQDPEFAPIHVFPSLMQRVPLRHRAKLLAFRPETGAPAAQRLAAFTEQRKYMHKYRHQLFPRDLRSDTCLRHPGKQCAVSFQDPVDQETSRPLTFAIAGVPCTPWSALGSGEKGAHPAIEAVNLVTLDYGTSNFDILGLENSDNFPPRLWREALPEKYLVKSVCFGPQEHVA